MAYPSISTGISGQKSAGISKLYIKPASGETWQSLGLIRNGELKVTPYSTEDTYKRNYVHAFTIEAKVELMQTSVAEVELIDSIVNGSNNFLFKLSDAAAIPSSAAVTTGWVILTSSQVGVSAKYQCDGNPSSTQFIELMIKGSIIGTSLDAILKASIDDGDFHITTTASQTYSNNNGSLGGTLFSYYNTTTADDNRGIVGNIKPNGFSTVQLQDSSDTSSGYTTAGRVRNGKATFDFIAEEDSLGRPNVYGVDVDIEYEYLVADDTNLLLLDSLNSTATDVKITLLDGKVLTLASKLGVGVSFENVGDFDKFRVLKYSHKGRISVSDFDGVVS